MGITRPRLCSLVTIVQVLTFAFWLLSSSARSQDSIKSTTKIVEAGLSHWVQTQVGELPIILSAPHGGHLDLPDVSARKGEGLAKGASGFFIGRDVGTQELAHEISLAIQERFGKLPYSVVSRVNRKYLDPNRPADIAFEDDKAEPIYKYYHATLHDYCHNVVDQYHAGVLIDIHGQGSKRDTVFRGTKNGLTVTHLRESFGQSAHTGSSSLFGLLQSRGWIVGPEQLDGQEQSGFTGGFIVQTYGSHRGLPIDAMQFEFGADYRDKARRIETASVLADALTDYANAYLKIAPPISSKPIVVPEFVDDGLAPKALVP